MLDHEAVAGGGPGDSQRALAGFCDFGDYGVRNAQIFEPLARAAILGEPARIGKVEIGDVLGGSRRQSRTVDAHQGLALVDVGAGRDVLKLIQEGIEAQRHDSLPVLVLLYVS